MVGSLRKIVALALGQWTVDLQIYVCVGPWSVSVRKQSSVTAASGVAGVAVVAWSSRVALG